MKNLNYNKNNNLFISDKEIKVGDIIKIGSNEWEVLCINDNHALLISHLLLDIRTFHIVFSEPVSYKDTSIREYINHNFLIYNFKRDFIPLIEETCITHDNGDITYDHMFLLSQEEAQFYFKDNNHRKAKDKFNYNEPWWLRNQHDNKLQAYFIGKSGEISKYPGDHSFSFGLRPAFWLKLNKEYNWLTLNTPLLADKNSDMIDKPYVGMKETEIEKTKCGPYYNALLTPGYNNYKWMSYLDCNFLQVSVKNGIVTRVLEMYNDSHWNEDGSPIYKGIRFK